VELDENDYVSGASVSKSSYEASVRRLTSSSWSNGRFVAAVSCVRGIDCQKKCEYLSQTARSGGLPAPEA
jgi:hypothetical protein